MVVLKKLFYVLLISLGNRCCIALLTIALGGISALQASTALAALNVTVDRNPVNIEDTFTITIEATQDIQGEPKLERLQENFNLLNISHSSSHQFGTGGTRYSFKRIVTAQAKHAGVITIPAIQWSGLTSSPLSLKVLPAGQRSSAAGGDFYVEFSSSDESPYVQGQVILTAKAFSNKQFGNGQFENPTMPDGIVAKRASSEDHIYTTNINGVAYLVQERRFILYAERSGEFAINGILFQGQFPTGRRSFFGHQSTAKQARSEALSLHVKAMPATAKQPWLPAKQLTLSHYLSEGDFKVGEPITLTLSTIADGLMGEQLPDFDLQLPDKLKAYPDQPEIDTNWNNGSVIAKRTDKIALIPTQAGRYTLPSIRLHWWNTQTDSAATAVIEEIHFEVTGAPVPSTPPASPPAAQSINTPQGAQSSSVEVIHRTEPTWKYATLLFASLWLITLLGLVLVLRSTPRKAPQKAVEKPTGLSKKQLIKQLKQAQAQTAAELLINWGRANIHMQINTIGQLMHYADGPLCTALEALNAQLYRADDGHWNASELIPALQNFQLREEEQAKQSTLKLYPE